MNVSVIDMSKAREVAAVSETTSLIQVIERAARDPSVDLDRMERLLQMHERLVERQAKTAYANALAVLQPTLPIIMERGSIKNTAGAVQSKYALWEDIVGVITPLLAAQGFSLSFRTGNPEGKIRVTGVLTHREGHAEETTLDLPADKSGSKNEVQAVASSVSYGKRYTAGALLNLRTGEPDTDGRSTTIELISEKQVADLDALISENNGNKPKLLRYLKLNSLADIPVKNYDYVVNEVRAIARRAQEERNRP